MAYFSRVEDYSIHDNGFYGEPEITYGSERKDDTPPPTPPTSTSGAWDDFQRELENIRSIGSNEHTR